jgi:hypothetical protein
VGSIAPPANDAAAPVGACLSHAGLGAGPFGLMSPLGYHSYTKLFSDMVSFTLNDSPQGSALPHCHGTAQGWSPEDTICSKSKLKTPGGRTTVLSTGLEPPDLPAISTSSVWVPTRGCRCELDSVGMQLRGSN